MAGLSFVSSVPVARSTSHLSQLQVLASSSHALPFINNASCSVSGVPNRRFKRESCFFAGESQHFFFSLSKELRFTASDPSFSETSLSPLNILSDPGPARTARRFRQAVKAPRFDVKILYDGECPVCAKQVNFLRERDADHRICYEDVASDDYDPDENSGVDYEMAMSSMHCILPDGTVLKGMDAIRRIYKTVGLGWISEPTGWPVLRPAFDKLYDWLSANRMNIFGEKLCDESCDQKL